MKKFSLAIALLCSSIMADSNIFSDGKFDGRIRFQYFNTNWDNNDWGNGADGDSKGSAIGGSILYKTAPLYGLSAGVGLYTTAPIKAFSDFNNGTTNNHPKNTTSLDLFARGPGSHTNYGKGFSVLGLSYLDYKISDTKIGAGRFLMENPWVSACDFKMIPMVFQGVQAISKDIDKTTIQFDYIDKVKERGMTYFGSMADTLDTPTAIKNYYHTSYTDKTNPAYGTTSSSDVVVFGIKNSSVTNLELQAWDMHWDSIINQAMLEANYLVKLGEVEAKFGARYVHQFDLGAGDIIKPKDGSIYDNQQVRFKGDNDNKIDTYMYALRAIFTYGASKVLLSYSHTNDGGDLLAPWRAFPTAGYTRSMTATDWNANTHAYKILYDYDFNEHIKGLRAYASYSYYDRDTSKVPYVFATNRYYNNNDSNQWNLDVIYKVPSYKGLELKLRYMIQNNDVLAHNITGNSANKSAGIGNDTSNHELRLEANYFF